MGWYAFEEIGEALEETRDMLLPFEISLWTRMAVIVLLTGSGFNLPAGNFSSPSPGMESGLDAGQTTFTSSTGFTPQQQQFGQLLMESGAASSSTMIVAGIVLAVFVFIGLPLMLLSSIFEFVFYRSLIDREVKLAKSFSDNIGRGLRYFAFRVVYALLILSVLAIIILLGMESSTLLAVLLIGFIPVLLVSAIFAGLTKHFILLRMMERDEGLIEAWRSFWPVLQSEWRQVAVFLVTRFFLALFVGAISATVVLAVTVMAAIPVIIMAAILSMIAEILFLVPVLLGGIIWAVLLLYIAVPFRVYLYYYVILVYHDLTS
ncbi:MAG: hypothetical protein ABEK10_03415 [Candidatus Nanosalina sp.]